MAFHVACPITCERICFCNLGFPQKLQGEKAKDVFLEEVLRLSELLTDPLDVKVRDGGTIQVAVPKVVKPEPVVVLNPVIFGDGVEGDEAMAISAQNKRVAMQKKAAVASLAAEDYARRFESGDLPDVSGELVGEEQGHSGVNIMCRMCFNGEIEGSERARKMLSCKCCGKKYHRSCIKNWAQHRDLFHWSSWTCPCCRTCELCRKTGDPNKFLFCKRCDGAYHCYCQHPPHKNVSSGPYLCQKHTRCHSCGSNVPGNGLSVRWFLGYTCCDACGRLFVKGNYCPVCLKVYRDSESTPMVCCDLCQRWVHCQCDGISDEKYMQFQVDGNLQYKCSTCHGESYEVKDLEDAVRELWRRRDDSDQDLIANQRAAAGLPTQEEIFSISPYSDDEQDGPIILKNEIGRSLKLSLKGVAVDKSPKKTKENGQKSSNKKAIKKIAFQTSQVNKTESREDFEHLNDVRNNKNNNTSHVEGICSINQPGAVKHKFFDEAIVGKEDRAPISVRSKSSKENHDLEIVEDSAKYASKPNKTAMGPKLVIHLGSRNKNVSNSRSDVSSCQREQEFSTSNGSEGTNQQRISDRYVADKHSSKTKNDYVKGNEFDDRTHLESSSQGVGGNLIKLGKDRSEASNGNSIRGDKGSLRKHIEGSPDLFNEMPSISQSLPKDSKPLLKLKFKNPCHENQISWVAQGEEEKNLIKGQRSKRKRPTLFTVKTKECEDFSRVEKNPSLDDEIMDANWILKKLGKDAIGKRVEVHLVSENSWYKGVVADITEGTSMLCVNLDDGRAKTLELGKQGIRFVPQKKKRSRT